MNKFYYLMQVLTITICSTCAVMVAVSILCSCTTSTANSATVTNARLYTAAASETFSDVVCDTAVQLAMCERILDGCAEHGILDARGVQVYGRLKEQKSVTAYIELIAECEREENFYDTIGSGDEWCNYVWHVLEPRGLAE